MKRVVTISILFYTIIFTFCACNKNKNDLVGRWQWSYSRGGLALQTIKSLPNIVLVTFNSDSTYTFTVNGTTLLNDKYNITFDTLYGKVIHLNNFHTAELALGPNGEIYTIKNNQLIFTDYMVSDGYSHYFNKIK